MEKLPSVFQNKVNKLESNDQKSFYSCNRGNTNNFRSINIDDIFKGKDFIYKRKVLIIYNNGEKGEEIIVSRNSNSLITIDNKKININSIKEIKTSH